MFQFCSQCSYQADLYIRLACRIKGLRCRISPTCTLSQNGYGNYVLQLHRAGKVFQRRSVPTCYRPRLCLANYRFVIISLAFGSTNCNDKERIMKFRTQKWFVSYNFVHNFAQHVWAEKSRFHVGLPMKSIFQFSQKYI